MSDRRGGEVSYELGAPGDLDAIRALLRSLHLPDADVGGPQQTFVVARMSSALVGCVAIEAFGEDALLRSLAVAPRVQGAGIGTELYRRAVAEAERSGARTLYLLTTTAEAFFARAGFTRVDRAMAPVAVAASAEFRALCPASAACMRRILR